MTWRKRVSDYQHSIAAYLAVFDNVAIVLKNNFEHYLHASHKRWGSEKNRVAVPPIFQLHSIHLPSLSNFHTAPIYFQNQLNRKTGRYLNVRDRKKQTKITCKLRLTSAKAHAEKCGGASLPRWNAIATGKRVNTFWLQEACEGTSAARGFTDFRKDITDCVETSHACFTSCFLLFIVLLHWII